MNFRKLGLILFIILGLFSCEDDSRSFYISQDTQNKIDDKALVQYLKDHYFAEDGTVKAFSSTNVNDDHFTPLSEFAQKDPSGYYIVKNENAPTSGNSITSNSTDSILLQYNLQAFRATEQKDSIYYAPSTLVSTVNDKGLPEWDPIFYYAGKGATNPEDTEIQPFIEGLKQFNASGKQPLDEPYINFQGLILVPSRLAYGRNINPYSNTAVDLSLVLNFELYQVVNRK